VASTARSLGQPAAVAAWALLAERLDEAARLCEQVQAGCGQHTAGQLEPGD
jgi:hypothetical protein